jgi:hypothetical protein
MGGACAAHFTSHGAAILGHPVRVAMIGPGFSKELRNAAAASHVVPRLICESPQEWRLGPLTVVVDGRAGTAQLRYARQSIAKAGVDAAEIMDAWTRALATLSKRSLAPEKLLPMLAATYRDLLARDRRGAGERVDLAELREQVVAARRGHTRAQFAYDLARLRSERRLVHEGLRIDLGVATGMATSRSGRVVWIEDESGAGQYYQTFRMVQEPR